VADVELMVMDRPAWVRVAADPTAFAEEHGVVFGVELETVRAIGTQTVRLLDRTGASPPWSGYLAVDQTLAAVVGTCGYTSPPNAAGEIEIAYFTFPAYEGHGYASAMARGLVERAAQAPEVHRISAHTLPERNASVRILEKLGFAQAGDAIDADVGLVWRWERLSLVD
jgi:[ribosomal protein S5]-alanine N-acetyltransferase